MTEVLTIERVANGWVVHPPIHYHDNCCSTRGDWHVYNTIEQLTAALPMLLQCVTEKEYTTAMTPRIVT
jgi:hypothetical protein